MEKWVRGRGRVCLVLIREILTCWGESEAQTWLESRIRLGKIGENLQDGGGIRHGDHLLPHKYIKNRATRGTTPTEHLLKAGRRPQTSQKTRKSPHTLLWGWQGLGALAGCQAWASEVGEPSSGHWSTRDLLAPSSINQQEFSQRSLSQCKDPAPLKDQQDPVLDTPCQKTSKTGTQPHPLTERLPKIIIRSQIPQNTPPDTVLPTRKTRSSLILQNTGTSPSTKESTQHTEPTLPTGGRHQKQWEL